MKVIWDIGASKGEDLPYYLLKAETVIAFEANPDLCRQLSENFKREIDAGRLVVVQKVIVAHSESGSVVPFYLSKIGPGLSQFPVPESSKMPDFTKTYLPSITVQEMLDTYPAPDYVKSDIENYDHVILNEFFSVGSFPRWISAEIHDFNVFLELIKGYSRFKIVDGLSVCSKYAQCSITLIDESQRWYSFPYCSSGPMGDDIDGDWISAWSMYRKLLTEGTGWKDLHATRPRKDTIKSFRSLLSLLINLHWTWIANPISPRHRSKRLIKRCLSKFF